MATSYPGAIDSFDTKVNRSDVYDASHINDLQDSVVAIQTALQAGIAAPSTPVAQTLYEDTIPKAWINWSGGASPVIDDDVNVASIFDAGTGDIDVTFATNMSSTNYSGVGATEGGGKLLSVQQLATTGFTLISADSNTQILEDQPGSALIVGNN